MKYRLEIQFDGSSYHGWQYQTNAISVQEVLNKSLAKLYKARVTTMGSGRTDAGVHALKYYVFYTAPFAIENDGILRALNSKLPEDIRVIAVELLTEDVHATIDAKSREYRYYFSNQKIATAFQANYITNVTYNLDYELMKKACEVFQGTYDFSRFQTVGSDVKTSTRTIFECSIHKQDLNSHPVFPDHYYIKFVGSGFLKQMVRLMVGAIWDVGRGRLVVKDIEDALNNPLGDHIAPVVPPNGLYKYDIEY